MSFIEVIAESDASDEVRAMYDRQQAHYGYLPNYARVFSHRPEVMRLWAQLQSGIRRPMDRRRFEIVTFVAAHALRSTLCTLAHGKLLTQFLPAEDVLKLARGLFPASLSVAEVAMVMFARKVARDASQVTAEDVGRLLLRGFSHAEVFDIAATAAARAFWTKLIESLGVQADPAFHDLDADFKRTLTVGRPLDFASSSAITESVLP
jgi:uncharacterized peroxidase-related enzyme